MCVALFTRIHQCQRPIKQQYVDHWRAYHRLFDMLFHQLFDGLFWQTA